MEDLGKALPVSEGMIDAETGTKKNRINEFCLNCGTKLIDSFCHHCGQKDIPKRQTLSELWTNFLSSFWSFEGKFFLTTRYLVTKPGFLAVEYSNGKRESYYHPARMYVFISFVFFLVFVSLPDNDSSSKTEVKMDKEDYKEFREKYSKVNVDSIIESSMKSSVWMGDSSEIKIPMEVIDSIRSRSKRIQRESQVTKKNGDDDFNIDIGSKKYKSVASYDSAQNVLSEDKRDGWFERKIKVREIELKEKYKGDMKQFGKDFVKGFTENFSKVLFWLLPVFALLLKLLYVRRDFFYSEHLVFSIYYYNFFYLAGTFQMIVNQIPGLGWLAVIIGFWIFFYLLFAMKRMYKQGWGKTILKFAIFSFAFIIFLGIGLSISALVILMMI